LRRYVSNCKNDLLHMPKARSKKRKAKGLSPTKIKIMNRRKITCYARKVELIERLFDSYGSSIRLPVSITKAAEATGVKKGTAYK
jgi:hypothetical protein